MSGRFKMVYIDGAYDSKAYGSINHFETTQAAEIWNAERKQEAFTGG